MKPPLKPVPTNQSITLHDDNDDLIAIGAPPLIDNGDMAEIARRVNVHEAIVKQRDDLIAQRDALAEAAKSALESIDIAESVWKKGSIGGGAFRGAFLGVRGEIVAALALTKETQ